MKKFVFFVQISIIFGQARYNHPELEWYTFETEHFNIHYHIGTEISAREAATVAEFIYPKITEFYDFEPEDKTDIILKDTDDYSNGAAYYYDNKIVIWASPLNFELRGSHRWLQNVITHEYAHIVSLQKSMKFGTKIPGAYLQFMGYEKEKRKDVLYGYPKTLISYPVPGTVVPPWLAEGVAQFMYDDADWDHWDTHRDMILRDRAINNKLLTFDEMNTFGKKGIGNESTYNAGFALTRFISYKYGSSVLKDIMKELSNPFQFSINDAIYNVLDIGGYDVYNDFISTIKDRYEKLTKPIKVNYINPNIIADNGTTNLFPVWSPRSNVFLYLSNKKNDYFGQTDLYLYDLDNDNDKKITGAVFSAPTWHPNGRIIYYSKKPKFPDKNGSKYFDIYEYDLIEEKETRITESSRGFSPVFVVRDSSIAFIATEDGRQDIFQLNLKSRKIIQLTKFDDRPIISSLTYNELDHSLYFDISTHHYRDIAKISLSDTSYKMVLNSSMWDERNIAFMDSGSFIYSDDRSGIFNLFLLDSKNKKQGYITNVYGGAFMPNINKNGRVLYSMYDNGGYKIVLIDSLEYIEESLVGYSPSYYMKNEDHAQPLIVLDTTESAKYIDQFPNMFLMPKIMFDYGTAKPGFYFYSSEILERLSLFGGMSINNRMDMDLFFIFEFNRLYPTLFFEAFFLTRHTTDQIEYRDTYDIDSDIKFRMILFRPGIKIPFYGSTFEVFSSWQRYRAFINESLPSEMIEAGSAYDYYRGVSINVDWKLNIIKPRLDGGINPSNGLKLSAKIDIENNKFIEGLDFSDAGTLVENFKDNNFTRLQGDLTYHYEIPWVDRLTTSFQMSGGYITNTAVDSFFHFFNGGMSGLKGYPFYSIEGTKTALLDLSFRLPLLREKHIKLGWFIMQNSVIGAIFQLGDAWRQKVDHDWKKSVGVQWRVNGFSFYNYPTAIELEIHQGLNKFDRVIKGETYSYGKELRTYFRLLFDF
ncbi:MAG: hypothetical protein CBD44_01800 [Flavobacteriaceae bacterium TMED184]|nr:MAG: hypothetical protein CBD44_01800 [Flavobacteriaceae bacterium TMED184]|tara:strand:+ start:6095 stop:9040 length:2946 start_codon:yes stop_codon:yes gene_type:complete